MGDPVAIRWYYPQRAHRHCWLQLASESDEACFRYPRGLGHNAADPTKFDVCAYEFCHGISLQ